MRTPVRVLAVAVMAASMTASLVAPASAQVTDERRSASLAVAFVGTATVTPLWSPVSPNCTDGTGVPTTCPSGSGGTWEFNSAAVAGLGCKTYLKFSTQSTFPFFLFTRIQLCTAAASGAVGSGSISASGSLTNGAVLPGAWCGASGGTGGTGSASLTGPTVAVDTTDPGVVSTGASTQSVSLSGVGWLQSAGSVLLVTGTATGSAPDGGSVSGPVVAVVNARPNPVGSPNSCLEGDGTSFDVAGVAAGALS